MALTPRTPGQSLHTSLSRGRYDVVIVGAGISGLSLAALLARTGRSVLVLESINYPGGCASSYEKDGAWFDVGATTFCGADPGQPLDLLFSQIGAFPGLLRADPTLAVVLSGNQLDLTTDRDLWTERMSSFFGTDQRRFWGDVFSVSDAIYGAVREVRYLPPVTPGEFLANLPAASFGLVSRLPLLFSSVAAQLSHRGIGTHDFRRFVDAQLLITNQTRSEDALMLNGALGLSYANGTVSSVRGGMIRFARFLEERARAFGAEISYLQRVTSIERGNAGWNITTARKETVRAGQVVTQVPLQNLPSITTGRVSSYFTGIIRRIEAAGVSPWAAVTLYGLVPDELPPGAPLNVQVILDQPMRGIGSDTLFCTFSHPQDELRCTRGFRTMTVSAHVSADWLSHDMTPSAYASLKEQCGQEMLSALRSSVPWLAHLAPAFTEVGTPKTFRKYTGRFGGYVGGLPLSRRIFPWKYPTSVTPFEGLYAMGDTFFPGQGIPGVVLGALGVHTRITSGDAAR